jgi:FkbM family methyltransferase
MRSFLLKILDKTGLLALINSHFQKKINGRTFCFPVMKRTGRDFLYSSKEPWMDQVLIRMQLKPDAVFLDVGANIGQTLIQFKSLYPDNPYRGFEPNPVCVRYLKQLIQQNRLQKCSVHAVGLSDHSGSAKLYRYNNAWDTEATLIQGFRRITAIKDLEVKIIPGDDLIFNHEMEPVELIKIDVEGGELEVLKGLRQTIMQQRPVIICEILPVYSSENLFRIQRQRELIGLLRNFKYYIYRIIKNPENEFDRFLFIEDIEIHKNLTYADYVLIPREKEIKIISDNCE